MDNAQQQNNLWIVKALGEGKTVYLPDYAGITRSEVVSKILRKARAEEFKGGLEDRLLELQWEIVMVVVNE